MDDMRYLDTLDDMDRELQQTIIDYNNRRIGMVGRANLLNAWIEENEVLAAIISKHRRVLKFLNGESVEPIAHSAEAVLIGVGSTGG